MADQNVLYYRDNLDVLRRHVKDESVDLVYLDPQCNSNADYNVLFAEHGTAETAPCVPPRNGDYWTICSACVAEQRAQRRGCS